MHYFIFLVYSNVYVGIVLYRVRPAVILNEDVQVLHDGVC